MLLLLMLPGGFRAIAQTSSFDAASRMEVSAKRQVLSLARQKKSVARLPGTDSSDGFFVLAPPAPGGAASAEAQCPALPSDEVDDLVTQAGEATSVPPDLLRSVMKEESGFRPCAVSPKGAMGLMQLMGSTANEFGVTNAFDPRENVTAGAKFLKQLINLYNGDLALALSAYNAGPGRVDAAGGIPEIPETIQYVNRILSAAPASDAAKRLRVAGESAGNKPLPDAGR